MILQVSQNRSLLKVGRLINVEKSRKKKRVVGAGCGRVICHYLKACVRIRIILKTEIFFSFVTELCVRFRLSIHMQR